MKKLKNDLQNRRTNAASVGSPFQSLIADCNEKTEFDSDVTVKQEKLQQDLLMHLIQCRKVIRCYRCFSCQKPLPLKKMSAVLTMCRKCLCETREKGKVARRNVLLKVLANLSRFLEVQK
jgi:hypothetical protein